MPSKAPATIYCTHMEEQLDRRSIFAYSKFETRVEA